MEVIKIKIKDVIKKLQELNDDDYKINIEVEPIINCIESINGDGWETTRYQYTIVLEGKEIVRKYKNEHGIKKYVDGDKE